ncbi:MAG: hypothetical protein H6741_16625 [Alphaproteobacteria bacterium]|nr:hypothetical protein [Alphaproteobacteria bacterium]MCB9794340.1 hypothetical protein [Alphaproteobacteria bacterium]
MSMNLHGWPLALEIEAGLLMTVISSVLPRGVQRGVLELVGAPAAVVASPPGGEPHDAALVGFEIDVYLPGLKESGRYAIWLRLRQVEGDLEISVHAVDPHLGRPAPSMPRDAFKAVLDLGFPTQRFALPMGLVVAPRSALIPGRRRLVLFASLSAATGLGPGSADARISGSTLLHRPGEGLAGGGVVGLHLGEVLALTVQGEVVRTALEGAVKEMDGKPIDETQPPTLLKVHHFRAPSLRSMGVNLDFDLELIPENKPSTRLSASGPVYLGGVLEHDPKRGLYFKLALNATELEPGGDYGAQLFWLRLLLSLTLVFAPPLLDYVKREVVAILKEETKSLRDSFQVRLDDAFSGLIEEVGKALPPGPLQDLLRSALLTRMALGSEGLTLGLALRPPGEGRGSGAQRGRSPTIASAYPRRFTLGYETLWDCFPEVPSGASISTSSFGTSPSFTSFGSLGGFGSLSLAPVTPTEPSVPQHPVQATLELSGDDLDVATSARLTRDGVTVGQLPILSRSPWRITMAVTLRGLQPGVYGVHLDAPEGSAWIDPAFEAGLAPSEAYPLVPRATLVVDGQPLTLMDGGVLGSAQLGLALPKLTWPSEGD